MSRHSRIKIKTVQYIKSRVWEKKEGKYSKTHAEIQFTAIFRKREEKCFTQIHRDMYGDAMLVPIYQNGGRKPTETSSLSLVAKA